MNNTPLARTMLYGLVALGLYLSYLVLRPFFVALTWAVIFAMLFRKMYGAIANRKRMTPNRAAGLTTGIVLIAIVAPAGILIAALAREAPQIAARFKETSQTAPHQIQRIWDVVRAHSPVSMPEDSTGLLTNWAQRVTAFLGDHAGSIATDSLATLATLGAMLFALFFMLRDGDTLSRQLRDRLPFTEAESSRLLGEIHDLVTASIGAGVVVAATQALIGTVAYWVAGLPAPLFWGAVTGFASVLPVVGASLIWLPAGVGLVLSGEIWRGVFLLLIGTFGISMVDNVLRPILLSGKTAVSGFVIFFGLLGGAAAFGLIGLVIGPIILVITSRILENARQSNGVRESVPVRRS